LGDETGGRVFNLERTSRRDRYRRAAALIERWLADESGYDEEIWPLLEEELKGGRMRCEE